MISRMKRINTIFASVVLLLLCWFAQPSFAQFNFVKIEYYNNPLDYGNVKNFYKLILREDGTGKLIYSTRKDSGKGEALIYELTISDEAKNEINNSLNENNIIETENQYADDKEYEATKETEFAKISYANFIPDSSMKPVVLKTMSTPIFPKEELRERLKIFYARIRDAVPEEVWRKLKIRN